MKARAALSRRAPHAGAAPVARTARQAAPAPRPPAASAAHALATMTVQPRAPHAEGTAAPAVQLLIERATAAPPQPLPHHALIQARLGRPLPPVETYSGAPAQAALRALGARAATLGHKVLFADPYPAVATVAHEVAHVLQAEAGSNTPHGAPVGAGDTSVIAPANSAAEREAAAFARALAHPEPLATDPGTDGEMRPRNLSVPPIGHSLAPGSLALQRTGDAPGGAPGGVAVLERPRPAPRPEEPRSPGPPSASPVPQPASAAAAAESVVVEDAAADLELSPAPEPDVTAEDAAAREAALAEAEAMLAGAEDTTALMQAFADAPPTVKAMQLGGLGEAMGGLAQRESQQMEEGLPELHATLSGEAQPAPPLAVAAPEARDVTLEASAPASAPEPAIAETLDLGRADANADLARAATRLPTGAEPAALAVQIEGSLQSVRTTDPALTPSPGPSPAVPLAGETDPQRIADQAGAGIGGARAARDDARTRVLEGPGPEQAQPRALDESYAVEGLNPPTVPPVAPVEGAERYLGMGMPPEVQAAFDEQQQGVMQASMAGAVAQAESATSERETARQAAIDETQTKAAELSRDADGRQRTRIGDARTQIQNERQATLDEQTEAVASLENDVATRRAADRGAIETRVTDDQATIAGAYATAERDAQAEIQKGEADAQAEKEKAEKASEEQSWWDRAASFVRDAFNALVDAINSIVDAVRSAVTVILDAVKAAALVIIDAAASFIKDAIAAFGEFLELAVAGLLGGIFPELAAALTEAIGRAVAAAQQAVDVVADGLKAGVAALVDGLKAGLNKILDLYQAGLNVAIGLVQAAVTGDWSALARKLLEAVLAVIGVDPERFYAFVGRAEETFEMILDDPGGFVGNLIDALLGGVRRFGTNFLTHLQAGIIGWLTGTLGSAGITLPERFDLMGVLHLAQQILGLTWDRLRQKAVRLVGERNVALLEHVSSYVDTLVTEGWAGLWRRVQGELSTLVDVVLDGIKSFLYEKVIMAAVTKIASLFNPVGAVVQLVLAAWNFYTFLRDQLARLMQVVQTVVDAVGDIARRILDPAMAAVETTLAGLLPLALDLLARLLGLGNVGEKVREIVTAVQERIDTAIDGLIERVLAAFRGGPSAAPAGAAPAGEPAAGVPDRTFRVAGETHTLRAIFTDGQASIVMASGPFGEFIPEMLRLLENLRIIYTRSGGEKYVGPPEAAQLEPDFVAIETACVALAQSSYDESDPVRRQRLLDEGFDRLRGMFNALGLEEATQPTAMNAVHDTRFGGPLGGDDRRQTWFEVNPLSADSLTRGQKPEADVPGVRILPGYHQGHLVAKSLGGPGSAENLVPMSARTNTSREGVVGAEDSLRYALGRFVLDHPQAQPPYVFSYRVTANYAGGPSELQRELEQHGVGRPGSATELFAQAQAATQPSDADVRATLNPTAIAALSETDRLNVPDNVRRRLAWHFMPRSISASIEVLQAPVSFAAQIYQSGTAPNHLGSDTEWH